MDEITRIQRCFARKAKVQPSYQFRDLYSLVWKPSFLEAGLDRVYRSQTKEGAEPTVNADGEPCAGKLARTVREAARGKHGLGCAPLC